MTQAHPDPAVDLVDLVDRWVQGWVVSRTGSAARRIHGGWEVHVAGSEKRSHETVLVEPDPATVAACADRVRGIDGSWLTLVTRDAWAAPLPGGVLAPAIDERLMTCDLTSYDVAPRPAEVEEAREGRRSAVSIRLEGELAAQGSVAVRDGTAVFDQVRTEPAFQRRGLGTRLMRTLSERAVRAGATQGVLASSRDGRGLYRSLGWTEEGHLLTLISG